MHWWKKAKQVSDQALSKRVWPAPTYKHHYSLPTQPKPRSLAWPHMWSTVNPERTYIVNFSTFHVENSLWWYVFSLTQYKVYLLKMCLNFGSSNQNHIKSYQQKRVNTIWVKNYILSNQLLLLFLLKQKLDNKIRSLPNQEFWQNSRLCFTMLQKWGHAIAHKWDHVYNSNLASGYVPGNIFYLFFQFSISISLKNSKNRGLC